MLRRRTVLIISVQLTDAELHEVADCRMHGSLAVENRNPVDAPPMRPVRFPFRGKVHGFRCGFSREFKFAVRRDARLNKGAETGEQERNCSAGFHGLINGVDLTGAAMEVKPPLVKSGLRVPNQLQNLGHVGLGAVAHFGGQGIQGSALVAKQSHALFHGQWRLVVKVVPLP